MLDPEFPSPLRPAERSEIDCAIVRAANATRTIPSVRRPSEILRLVARECRGSGASAYAMRILQGPFLAFESQADRFAPPDPCVFRHPGVGLLNFTVRRMAPGVVDIWMQVHHMPVDAGPAQNMLRRLESKLGIGEMVVFPAPDSPVRRVPCVDEGRDLTLLNGFFDFAPVRDLQQKLNARFRNQMSEPATVSATLLWCMAHQAEFFEARLAFLVIVPADETFEEGIDFAVVCPRDFLRRDAPDCGFVAYAADFARRVNEARSRRSRKFRLMKATAQLPAFLAQAALRLNPRIRQRSFGTLLVSVLPTARSATASMSDVGYEHGISVILNFDLPSTDGRNVGAVSIKGEPVVVDRYPLALRRALANASDYLPPPSDTSET